MVSVMSLCSLLLARTMTALFHIFFPFSALLGGRLIASCLFHRQIFKIVLAERVQGAPVRATSPKSYTDGPWDRRAAGQIGPVLAGQAWEAGDSRDALRCMSHRSTCRREGFAKFPAKSRINEANTTCHRPDRCITDWRRDQVSPQPKQHRPKKMSGTPRRN